MKILTAHQIRKLDAYTIASEPIKSIDLMERASCAFVEWFGKMYNQNVAILIIAGAGNNGGDALAIARLLHEKSFRIKVFLALPDSKGSPDYQINLSRLQSNIKVIDNIETDFDSEVIIDGLVGSGLTRPIEGVFGELVAVLNKLERDIISIDVASGLVSDEIAKEEYIIRPAFTISFQLPKLAFMLSENFPFVGQWNVVDIGLDQNFISTQQSSYNYLTQFDIQKLIKTRDKFSHKGVFGHTLIVGGSFGKIGAVVLAAKACLRSGAGRVTTLLPSCGYEIMQTSVPEVMCLTSGEKQLQPILVKDINNYSSIGIGPGLGKSTEAALVLTDLINTYDKPMVLDADALNLLAENPELLKMLPENCILTPHVGEFNRLVGVFDNSLDRLKEQSKFSQKHKVIIVLKGPNTSISDINGTVWFNSTGNPGMATAGSGDVLTGMITSLLAQGYSSLQAAQLAVFIHGRAGDIAKNELGEHSLIASDLTERISDAFISLN